jgi:hypothetical protein
VCPLQELLGGGAPLVGEPENAAWRNELREECEEGLDVAWIVDYVSGENDRESLAAQVRESRQRLAPVALPCFRRSPRVAERVRLAKG